MRALFVSDVHASGARPGAVEDFRALLGAAAGRLDALYVLGDLFDQWLGDDDRSPLHAAVEGSLRAVAEAGTAVAVQHGNHDFLLGTEFAARTGTRLLGETETVTLGSVRTVLMHGDTLCTDDTEYQAFRRYTRDPDEQRRFLELDLTEREAKAAALRDRSAGLKQLKPEDIMDANDDAVRAALRDHDARLLIHGHTHRPAVHELDLGGTTARRIVLGDWYEVGRVALHTGDETVLLEVPEAIRRIEALPPR